MESEGTVSVTCGGRRASATSLMCEWNILDEARMTDDRVAHVDI
jgi:hypothetical protein